jgi:hypothetical protein
MVLFACPFDDEEDEKNPSDVEFTLLVGQSQSWTPFQGKNGVFFNNANNSVLGITDNGTAVTFTGLKSGNSTITAVQGNRTAAARVTVLDNGSTVDPNDPDIDDPFDPNNPNGGGNQVFYVDGFYWGDEEVLLDYRGTIAETTHDQDLEIKVNFIYKMKVMVLKGAWQMIKNGLMGNYDEWVPIMLNVDNWNQNGFIQDGYISASVYHNQIGYSNGKQHSYTLTATNGECTKAENIVNMVIFYNKKQNAYRLMITGWIESSSCPYYGTEKYVDSDGDVLTVPWTEPVGYLTYVDYFLNLDNEGNDAGARIMYYDPENKWIEDFMQNPAKNILKFDFETGGEAEWSYGGMREKTLKGHLEIGN